MAFAVLERGSNYREVKITVNVWTIHRDGKKYPLLRGDHCMMVPVNGGLTIS